jgi:hypothetical protein
MVPKKSPRIPLELHQIKAYEFYQKRLASGKEGNEIVDILAALKVRRFLNLTI